MNRFQGTLLHDVYIPKDEVTNELPAAKDGIEQQKTLWNRFLEETRRSSEKENAMEYCPTFETKQTGAVEKIGSENYETKENDCEISNERKSEETSVLENIYTTHKTLVEARKIKQQKLAEQNNSSQDSEAREIKQQKLAEQSNSSKASEVRKIKQQKLVEQSNSSKASVLSKKYFKNKKKKPSVLEECRKNWDQFKKEEGIDEDLAIYNKGRAGYLEKQAFLYRCDWRSFEYERKAKLPRLKLEKSESSD